MGAWGWGCHEYNGVPLSAVSVSTDIRSPQIRACTPWVHFYSIPTTVVRSKQYVKQLGMIEIRHTASKISGPIECCMQLSRRKEGNTIKP